MEHPSNKIHVDEFPHHLSSLRRIAIVGNAGGGKTSLASLIGEKMGHPVFSLDAVQWKPGWVRTEKNEFDRKHAELISHSSWIIEGWGYIDSLEDRLLASELVIFIDLSLFAHYRWAIKRQIKNIFIPRKELAGKYPIGMNTIHMLIAIMRFHYTVRPVLLQYIDRLPKGRTKILHITSPDHLRHAVRQLHHSTAVPFSSLPAGSNSFSPNF